MAVTTTTARGADAATGRSSTVARAPGGAGEAAPIRSRPIATASSEDEIDRQTNRLQDLLDTGDSAFNKSARRGTYLNIVI